MWTRPKWDGLAVRERVDPGGHADAERVISKALLEKPELARAHFNLALAHEARGQIERAMAEYEAEIAQTPKAFKAAFNLGKLLLMSDRPEEAVRQLAAARKLERARRLEQGG